MKFSDGYYRGLMSLAVSYCDALPVALHINHDKQPRKVNQTAENCKCTRSDK
jgi:hypothetical protein